MEIKDKKLAQLISKANLPELEYRILECATEEDMEQEHLTEWEYVLREAEWIVEDFEDDGHVLYEELEEAKWLLRRTKNGKVIPISIENGFRPLDGFQPHRIEWAKRTKDEYRRTKAFVKRLERRIEKL